MTTTSPLPGDGLCQSRPLSPVESYNITILHCNIRGFLSHTTELEGRLTLLSYKPMIITLNETFLDESVKAITLSGYSLISRRDRDCHGGGIALFCLESIFDAITHLKDSEEYERSWHTLHSDLGPLLLCNWYRPPNPETASIDDI